MAIITLLTDFGSADGYVGAMKGVLLARAPNAQLVDLTHGIPAGDVAAGAWALRVAAPCFPEGTIHLSVVDPGVGTKRRPILLHSRGQLFVGPDNGLFSWIIDGSTRAWVLDRPSFFAPRPSNTFHGRDVFASVAGHLAAGVSPERCGTPTSDWRALTWPAIRVERDGIFGEVIHVDGFGNLITNISEQHLLPVVSWEITLEERAVGRIRQTFGCVEAGAWVAYIGSAEFLEVAVRGGAAAAAGYGVGTSVSCRKS